MDKRIKISSGALWETKVGYSRAVVAGNTIEISGTVATDALNNVVAVNDAYGQTKFILEKIEGILKEAGASKEHVIKTRMYVTDISRWEEYGKAHREFFSAVKPCTTMVEVNKLIDKDYLIEIEATALV